MSDLPCLNSYNVTGIDDVSLDINSKLGDYSGAVTLYTKFGELDSLQDLCHMGLAFYKSQQYTESYQGLYHMILMSRSESFILWMWKLVMIYDIVIGVSKCYWILTAYDKALEVSTNDTDSSQIHAALGMVAYKFGDIDGAKASLFQRLEILILYLVIYYKIFYKKWYV